MATLKIASFNVENLFRRAKLLNLEDRAETTRLLKLVDQLQAVLKKPAYTAADKAKIVKLCADLKGYATVQVDRGKLFSGQGTSTVVATGKGDWDGEISFNQEKVADGARTSTAAVMKAVKADVCCVVEAESRPVLKSFNSEMLSGAARFDYPFLIDGNDQRGIDVGVLSKLPIGPVHTHLFEKSGRSALFSRDCLHVELGLPDGRTLHLLCNHLKSKMNNDAASDARRTLQADRIAAILDETFDLRTDLVVVAGDLNDTPDSAPLRKLLGKTHLHDALQLQFGPDMAKRWTYKYRNQLNQIDYLLLSTPLKEAFVQAGVERRGIWGVDGVTGEQPFPSVTSYSNHASDHAAVWVEVEL
ncbi:MAG TPA: endonuclease/exonuclease/phosphatase family protein [Flavobacteriales bacterium]|nr:endonuclease/exonuclease/phosphatase family protein [Flavobacteriales bacterium]